MDKRVFFEEADRPPPEYTPRPPSSEYTPRPPSSEYTPRPPSSHQFKTPSAEEWIQAPEFVPRRRQSNSSFDMSNPLAEFPLMEHPILEHPQPIFHPGAYMGNPMVPPNVPFPPNSLPFLPAGYTANITNINAGIGPPIPAIVLKKKRRKRNKHTNSMVIATEENVKDGEERCASDDIKEEVIHPTRAGSCPDLSEDQMQMWDDFLYDKATQNKTPPPPAPKEMLRSVYDSVPKPLLRVAQEQFDGYSSDLVRQLDREMNGNTMTDSTVLSSLNHIKLESSDASHVHSLAEELAGVQKYSYPQWNDRNMHMATFNPESNSVKTMVIDRDEDQFIEDSIQGFNIRVNAFDECDNDDLDQPSRFQQIHFALQNARYSDLRGPEKACCAIS